MVKRVRTIKKLPKNSFYFGKLPKGCKLCGKGAKLVLLVTGKCGCRCFYCPLSAEKKGRDVIFANEKLVRAEDDIIEEAKLINALGTGITGGDPMAVPSRTVAYIKLLKNAFGHNHHIHLYTAAVFNRKYVRQLSRAGLDEIRFHPTVSSWGKSMPELERLIQDVLKTDMEVGVEVPTLPELKCEIIKFALQLDEMGIKFLNLNELEYSSTNWEILNARGYTVKTDISSAVKGSESAAKAILKSLSRAQLGGMAVHYCSASYKDAVQLRNRIMRRAKNIARKYHIITDDGTLLTGIIELEDTGGLARPEILEKFGTLESELRRTFEIPRSLIAVDHDKLRLELAPWVLEEIAVELKKSGYVCFIIEEYPTADRLEVERTPL